VTRAGRAALVRAAAAAEVTDKRQTFVDFVLPQHVKQGVNELHQPRLSPRMQLKYRAVSDVFADPGKRDQVGQSFLGFRQHLHA
jgi:type I restriction enzyme, R subunit